MSQSQQDIQECYICYEDANTFDSKQNYMIQLKPCNHWLCYTCLVAAGKFNCPFCRSLITFDSSQQELYQQIKKSAIQLQIYLQSSSNAQPNVIDNNSVNDTDNNGIIIYEDENHVPIQLYNISIQQRLQERFQIMLNSNHYYMLHSPSINSNEELFFDQIEHNNEDELTF